MDNKRTRSGSNGTENLNLETNNSRNKKHKSKKSSCTNGNAITSQHRQ